jgi:hypothetical protein
VPLRLVGSEMCIRDSYHFDKAKLLLFRENRLISL